MMIKLIGFLYIGVNSKYKYFLLAGANKKFSLGIKLNGFNVNHVLISILFYWLLLHYHVQQLLWILITCVDSNQPDMLTVYGKHFSIFRELDQRMLMFRKNDLFSNLVHLRNLYFHKSEHDATIEHTKLIVKTRLCGFIVSIVSFNNYVIIVRNYIID